MYEKQIEQLVILQKVDDEIILLESEIDQAPKDVAALESRHASLTKRKTQIEEKLEMLRDQQKRLELEIEEDDVKIKKSKSKLMMVGNTKEYHAMMREMDSLEKLNRLREDEKVTIMEETERQKDALKDIDEKFSVLNSELEEKRIGLKTRLEQAQGDLDKLNTRRRKACDAIPEPILNRYEFIRSRLEHPVIVPVEDAICSGCHIMIPPQIYNDLQKGHQIISCPNCQRLIFWIEHFPESARPESMKKPAAE
ncbi:zinc ribbon domain-containing protein [Maridesulfovibrio bastinii]|uniref:zinc ribbon domain-containing protein n=1 Tax=Maridesulfovibrio bastinii TaxID=47157 RepID=UPI0003FD4B72|nr:C4-type zinc ribbon domain-containing protein [Maridesulfovibrio bastinii]